MRSFHRYILALTPLTIVPGLKTIAKAQNLAGLPACAQPALLAAFQASGCKATDTACLCMNPELLTSLPSYIKGACSKADQAAVLAFGHKHCEQSSASSTTVPGGVPVITTSGPVLPSAMTTGTTRATAMTMSTSMSTTPTGGATETELSAAALAIAVGGMGWLFAEL